MSRPGAVGSSRATARRSLTSDYEYVAREIADALNKRLAYPKLIEALAKLTVACENVSPFSGDATSVKKVREAGKFMGAFDGARALLRSLGEEQ